MTTNQKGSTRMNEHEDSALLMERDDGWYFTGSLTAGQALAWQDRYSAVGRRDNGVWFVNLNDQPTEDPDDMTPTAEFGAGRTLEEAWRYALGAYFGPADADYFETGGDQRLGEALDTGRWPAVSTGNEKLEETVVLVAFNVPAHDIEDAQHKLLPYIRKTLEGNGGPAAEWWVAEDTRIDGSDNDSAVFVKPGEQSTASRFLIAQGLTGEHNLKPGGYTFGPDEPEPKVWSILIVGNPGVGFTHYGPMPKDAAWAEGEKIETEWWVMDLKDPKGLS